jgi:hypothetical protein
MIRFYLAPIIIRSVGDRSFNASKVEEYLNPTPTTGLSRSICANPWRSWAISWVHTTEAEHRAIQADKQITLIPFWDAGGNYLALDGTVGQITAANRNAIKRRLETLGVPSDWITTEHKIREVLRFVIRLLHIAQMLRDGYPNLDLSMTVGDISANRQWRVKRWMEIYGIDTSVLSPSTPIRRIVTHMVTDFPWGSDRPHLGEPI